MQVTVKTPLGAEVLEQGRRQIVLSSPLSLLEIKVEPSEQCSITIDGRMFLCKKGKNFYRIAPDAEKLCSVTVECNDRTSNYRFLYEEADKMDPDSVADLIRFHNDLHSLPENEKGEWKLSDFFGAVENGQISLMRILKPRTGFDNNSLLETLKSTLSQKVRAICSRPQKGLRVEEIVQDVSQVKRINSNTLRHLAAHTEHWKKRTITGLVPSRLKADIIEDEIDIYENLFFRKAISDIEHYVNEQITSLRVAKKQKENVLNWEALGGSVNDYNRGMWLKKVLPKYDNDQMSFDKETYDEALKEWNEVSKLLGTIRASIFYKAIDKKKRIGNTVHLTNILKNDDRYRALYELWCIVRNAKQVESFDKGDANDFVGLPEEYYATYTFLLLLCSMRFMGIEFEQKTCFSITEEGTFSINAVGYGDRIVYRLQTCKNAYNQTTLSIELETRSNKICPWPLKETIDIEKLETVSTVMSYDIQNNSLHLHKKPNSDEMAFIERFMHFSQSDLKRMGESERKRCKELENDWQNFVKYLREDSNLRDTIKQTFVVIPTFYNIDKSEIDIKKATNDLFNDNEGHVCYFLPTHLEKYASIASPSVLNRLLNYGEAYAYEDNADWKNYNVGILPVVQTDIGVFIRLTKLIAVHQNRILMQWDEDNFEQCPRCGSYEIKRIDHDTWRCKENGCGILWGKTRCQDGCKEVFNWICPDNKMKKNLLDSETAYSFILRKESLFAERIITDFELEENGHNEFKMYPVCPKCGKRRKDAACGTLNLMD